MVERYENSTSGQAGVCVELVDQIGYLLYRPWVLRHHREL